MEKGYIKSTKHCQSDLTIIILDKALKLRPLSQTMAIQEKTKTDGPLKILIAGAGIGGLTAAIALGQQGHEVTVRTRGFESIKRPY
jgi:NADPH-dependent 2,4-dienoyl-CoA reductase/sulfur reductase-like enzyme